MPVVDNPISRKDNTLAVVRLLDREEVTEDVVPAKDQFLQQWMQGTAARSKITTYLDDRNQAQK